MSQDDISYNVWALFDDELRTPELVVCSGSGKEVKNLLFEKLRKDIEGYRVELLNDNMIRFGFHCTYEEMLNGQEECMLEVQEFLEGVKSDELCSTWRFGGMEHAVAIQKVEDE